MTGFIGIGAQEILLLACCGTVPLAAAVVAFLAGRRSARKSPPGEDEF